jgi:MFS transporter, FSR family, fosmidomycin resistance protein
MVMAQQFLPTRIGTASGLSIGFSIGLGGIVAVILGGIADGIDLRTALLVSAGGGIVATVLTTFLPPERVRTLEPEVAVP